MRFEQVFLGFCECIWRGGDGGGFGICRHLDCLDCCVYGRLLCIVSYIRQRERVIIKNSIISSLRVRVRLERGTAGAGFLMHEYVDINVFAISFVIIADF